MGKLIAAFGFWALSCWALLIPFISEERFFMRLEPHGDLLFILMISIGVVLMHFERAREEQRQVAERYASLFASAPVGLFRIDDQGRMVQLNPTLCAILGVAPDEGLLTLDALGHEEATRRRLSAWLDERVDVRGEELMLSGAKGPLRAILELRWRRDEGGQDWADGVLQDITAEHAMRERIERGQRVEALGRLAGGIAHDFNNILTVVISSLDLARYAGRGDDEHKHVERAMEGAERAADLTRKLLSLTRRPLHERGTVEVGEILAGELQLLERALGETITLDVRRPESPLYVRAEKSELSQIIINLVLNARDAMPKGGRIAVSLASGELAGAAAVCLRVSDTGPGMDEATRARIFDPFFTTKGLGEGTGLGLATVYGIVQSLGGEIAVQSELGEGTSFEIVLPAEVTADAHEEPIDEEKSPPRRGRILVVEDEPGVRLMAERILRLAGHEVRGAGSAEEAVALLGDESVDLLVSDVVLPRASGPELVAKLRSQIERVLYISGYTQDRLSAKELEGASFLAKPFTAERLREAVNEALE